MPLLRPRSRTRRLRGAETRRRWMGQVQEGERGRRKWILIPLILFMLITRLSPAKDFHNNRLVLPLGSAGEKVVDVELTKILPKAESPLWLSQMQYFHIFSFLRCAEV